MWRGVANTYTKNNILTNIDREKVTLTTTASNSNRKKEADNYKRVWLTPTQSSSIIWYYKYV